MTWWVRDAGQTKRVLNPRLVLDHASWDGQSPAISPARWSGYGFGYAFPQPPATADANGAVVLTWNPEPTQRDDWSAMQGVRIGSAPHPGLDLSKEYVLEVTVQAPVGAARWRPCVAYYASGPYITPDGTPRTAQLRWAADIAGGIPAVGVEVERPSGGWKSRQLLTQNECDGTESGATTGFLTVGASGSSDPLFAYQGLRSYRLAASVSGSACGFALRGNLANQGLARVPEFGIVTGFAHVRSVTAGQSVQVEFHWYGPDGQTKIGQSDGVAVALVAGRWQKVAHTAQVPPGALFCSVFFRRVTGPSGGVLNFDAMALWDGPDGRWITPSAAGQHTVSSLRVTQVDDPGVAIVRASVAVGGQWRRFYPDEESTQTTFALPSGLTIGVASTATGTIVSGLGSISGGTVTIEQRVAGGSWQAVSPAVTVPGSGTTLLWSASVTPALAGATEFRAVYSGSGLASPSQAPVQGATVGIRAPGKPSGGAIGNTSATFSWAAVPGATAYRVFRNGVLRVTQAGTSYTDSGLANATTYTWTVQAETTAGKGAVSASSPGLQGRTGRAAIQDSGSDTIDVDASATGSYRPDVGWGYIGDRIGQGYYSDSGRIYTGVIDYGGEASFRSKCIAALGANGADRFDNMTITDADVYLFKRSGVGSGGSVSVSFYYSTAAVNSGGAPPRSGSASTSASAAGGAGAWHDIATGHANALKNGTARSLVISRSGSADYAQFDGKSSGASRGRLRLAVTWDYQLQSAVSAAWL